MDFDLSVQRLLTRPIISSELDVSLGGNINGPSLIRVPDWVSHPLGRYYLYLGHHQGQFIRLAYANELTGPWQIYTPGVLHVENTPCHHHIASPDVHVEAGQIRMYFHGVYGEKHNFQGQRSFVALSQDGLSFEAREDILGPFYMRVFSYQGKHYAIAKRIDQEGGGVMLRSADGLSAFASGPTLLPRMRHAALMRVGDTLWLFYSRGQDRPEHILVSAMSLKGDWQQWQPSEAHSLLKPEYPYEGADLPLERSAFGAVHQRVHQLRDPAIFEEQGKTYLLYSTAGEMGIAIAELVWH